VQKPFFNKKYIFGELDKLSSRITDSVEFIIIGGLGLMHFGLKDATKDVDVILQKPSELRLLVKSLENLGYHSPSIVEISRPYRKMEASKILENDDGFRWDIFYRQVCGALILSDEMVTRASVFYRKKLVTAFLASKEDLFLFKGITEREADLDDMRLLAESGLKWNVIQKECDNQTTLSGRLWENALLSNLIELEKKYNIKSPLQKRLEVIVEEKLIDDTVLKALRKRKNTIATISKTTKLPEYLVRVHIKKMEQKGLIRVDRSKSPYKIIRI
jgi:hypothetical protein